MVLIGFWRVPRLRAVQPSSFLFRSAFTVAPRAFTGHRRVSRSNLAGRNGLLRLGRAFSLYKERVARQKWSHPRLLHLRQLRAWRCSGTASGLGVSPPVFSCAPLEKQNCFDGHA